MAIIKRGNYNNKAINRTDTIDKKVSKSSKNDAVSLMGYPTIERIERNIDTGKYYSNLKYYFKGNIHKIRVVRSDYLTKRRIIELQDFGLDITEKNADEGIMLLQAEEEKAPIFLVHSNVGFGIYNGELVFKHHNCVNLSSSYCGDLDITPTGECSDWYRMIRENVIGNIPLEAILVIGFSSAIVGLLSLKDNQDSMLIHLTGDSTTGKTTASMLAISIWGNPSTKINNGLASTWNTTENAMFNNIVGNYGLATLFDEISMNDSQDFTKFVYKFTGNKDKKRMKSDSKIGEEGTWGSVFFSNGEFSLIEKSKKNTGALMRIIEFNNVAWTIDAQSADSITNTIINNYGHAGMDFMRKLLETDIETILNDINVLRDQTILSMNESGLTDKYVSRRSWKYNIIIYTAFKIDELLKIPLHIDDIWDFLMENEKQSVDIRDISKNSLEYFVEQVNINYKKFLRSDSSDSVSDDNIDNPTFDIMGKINILPNSKYNEICIFPDLFKKLMKGGGYEDPRIILKSWREQGILDCEADRFTRKRKILDNGGIMSIYIIRVSKDEVADIKEL